MTPRSLVLLFPDVLFRRGLTVASVADSIRYVYVFDLQRVIALSPGTERAKRCPFICSLYSERVKCVEAHNSGAYKNIDRVPAAFGRFLCCSSCEKKRKKQTKEIPRFNMQ